MGFLDYHVLDSRIRSRNVDMRSFDDGERYDIVYSVSVIEHMPAAVRRAVIAQISRLLRPEGRLLCPGHDSGQRFLWNYSEGVVVDEAAVHGTLPSIKEELAARGANGHVGREPHPHTDASHRESPISSARRLVVTEAHAPALVE